ncbi:hypothetical protein F511_35492 [Dorcoceras hygrometricum]|uniref:Mitochondrial transcription termination factor family protein n=1 Tax=Dorcoceras hygrometricum TaxID=472368 RepID=A0A2Z7CMG0_9LAMI|nr:hypothetical protein F511_35492 [Dorcoceras hygrometricum]
MATRDIIRPLLQCIKKSTISSTDFRSISVSAASDHSDLASLFQRYGFSPSQLPDLFRKNKFLLQSSSSEIEESFEILLSLKPSQDFLLSTVGSCPRVLELEFLKNWQKGLLQLRGFNITTKAVKNFLEIASKLGLSSDGVLKCILYLKELGLSESTIIRILEEEPMIMVSKRDEIMEKVEFLLGIGFQRKEIDIIIRMFPPFVKDVLKPSWRQGNMSKEAFKTIVKKTVDKVSSAMKSHRIPKSQARINHYIDSSRGKLTKLIMFVLTQKLTPNILIVKTYPELEKVYGRFSGEVQVQSRHPVGMWKLFTPRQYLESKEDAITVSVAQKGAAPLVSHLRRRGLVPYLFRDDNPLHERRAGSPDDDHGLLLREKCIVYGLTWKDPK